MIFRTPLVRVAGYSAVMILALFLMHGCNDSPPTSSGVAGDERCHPGYDCAGDTHGPSPKDAPAQNRESEAK